MATTTMTLSDAATKQFTVHVPMVLHQLQKDAMKVKMADPLVMFNLLLEMGPVKLDVWYQLLCFAFVMTCRN